MASFTGQPAVLGRSEAMKMILLAFCGIGISFTWSVEMTYCTPYLLNLGLTKSNTSLVWIAGPLSGLIVQPIVGVIADDSTSKWGRRRPLMVIGTAITVVALLMLGFTKEFVGLFVGGEEAVKRPTIVLAVLSIYVVDFAINAIMSCSRSLLVDTLPASKQQLGAAWASRMGSLGHVIGYGAGALDLVSIFGTSLGNSQFQQLTVVATIIIISTVGVTCYSVTERVLVTPSPKKGGGGRFHVFVQIWTTLRQVPPRVQAIFWAQFWSWIGWFPFLFYSTTWVGETYFRYDIPAGTKTKDVLGEMGRIGSIALVIYSTVTSFGAFIFPLLVRSPDEKFGARPSPALPGFLQRFNDKKPDLLTAWIIGQLLFSASMIFAPFATSFRFATILVAICGFSWTMAMWAPPAFLGVEVSKMSGGDPLGPGYHRLSNENLELGNLSRGSLDNHPNHDDDDSDSHSTAEPLHLDGHPEVDVSNTSSTGELSGVYFGLLNIYTTLPQFVGTFISTIVFAILEPGKSKELASEGDNEQQSQPNSRGPNAIAVCLFIGALCTLRAAYATKKLRHL